MKIPEQIIPETYNISKKVYEKNLTYSEGKRAIASNYNVNEGSIGDYINNFKYLLEGIEFRRTLNTASMDYFLDNIYNDYGKQGLSNALSALQQHIDYYESIQKTKTTMRHMRALLKKYSKKINTPILITNIDQLKKNLDTVEYYFTEGNADQKTKISQYIKRGTCFVAYQIDGEMRFAPSKFLGYADNSLDRHIPSETDGRDTNKAIRNILRTPPIVDRQLEDKYLSYCSNLGIQPSEKGAWGATRKFWIFNLQHDFESNSQLTGEFPEGKMVERTHKIRERNSKVVQLAKDNFKKKFGKLFCQICGFDFENIYGQIGKDYIEGHHTIAVSEMTPDHKTKPEDIAILCSNCHKMIHKKRPWLTMDELRQLLNGGQ